MGTVFSFTLAGSRVKGTVLELICADTDIVHRENRVCLFGGGTGDTLAWKEGRFGRVEPVAI